MMKVRLLSDGGHEGLVDVKFPVIVNGFSHEFCEGAVTVSLQEINRIGGDDVFLAGTGLPYLSFLSHEFEVIDE